MISKTEQIKGMRRKPTIRKNNKFDGNYAISIQYENLGWFLHIINLLLYTDIGTCHLIQKIHLNTNWSLEAERKYLMPTVHGAKKENG